ncbi:HDOD domain-containing protein [Aestuariirhabdus sp. Z084]|uniref:HDOD domain-containing protein n=1 Tax=Aestuariirhabdus haliotis TaxID=2918751 RepID=UPI00201B3B6D|nr:HDOD domain-containing protein [Aestuariirhabdus haliotis]MCL6415626.1 HDOD domain-containing protein [Aestuariirhabdus haliotis]MCL6419621.1 HDOD domain-containing protein [Aestuariirhabdus haliotis]
MSSDLEIRTAQDWKTLLESKPLPVMEDSYHKLLGALKDENTSLYSLAQMMKSCPVICLHVLSTVNKSRKPDDSRVINLEHALSLLGLTPLQQLLASLKPINPRHSAASQYYCQAITSSYHAARQAQHWYQELNRETSETAFWTAMFAQMVRWPLWLYAPNKMRQLKAKVASGKNPQTSEEEVLGCTLEELTQLMDTHWPLPQLEAPERQQLSTVSASEWLQLSRIAIKPVLQRFAQAPFYDRYLYLMHDHREIKLIKNGLGGTVTLANMIAEEANHGWYSTRMRRLLRLLALLINRDFEDSADLCHQTAIDISHESMSWLMPPPATALLWPVRQSSIPQANIKQPVASAHKVPKTPSPGVTPRKANLSHFKAIHQQLIKQPQSVEGLPQLAELLGRALYHGLGFDRVVIALPNKERSRLISFKRFGDDNLHFTLDLTQRSLMQNLMQKPASVWVKGPQQTALWNQIPPAFLRLVANEQFFLRSLFAGERSAGLIFADMGISKRPLSDQHYQYFQALAKASGPVLMHLARKPKPGSQPSKS